MITNFGEAQRRLRRFYRKDTTYTLDRMRTLMAYLGNPQDKLRVVHVAGTSGKTSTCYFVASLLRHVGYKTGLTVSPHVDEVNERVQIDGQPMPEAAFCAELTTFLRLVAESGSSPSYFESLMAFAYWEFARQKVDYAVVEVGLGGLLDATNVITHGDKICVITDIGLDHTEVLGDTLAQIAAQKAGIILPGNQVFAYAQNQEVDAVLMRTAARQHATLHRIESLKTGYHQDLPLFQQRNFYLADQVVGYVLQSGGHRGLTPAERQAAASVYIPGRMETVRLGDKTLIVDGAHNAQKLQTLLVSVQARYPGQPIAALVGFVEGDAFRLHQALEVLTAHCQHMIITGFYSEKDYPKRSVDPAEVLRQCQQRGYDAARIVIDPAEALPALCDRPEKVLLVTGSFYLLNHIRPLLARSQE